MKRLLLFLSLSFLLFSCDDEGGGVDSCGNNTVDSSSEYCDGQDLAGKTCTALGQPAGVLACNADCTFDISGCTGGTPSCGDNAVNQESEECDGQDLGNLGCQDLGFDSGTLQCGSDCLLDTSLCESNQNCGNGVIDSPETCDGTNLGAATCESQGYGPGVLSCTSSCQFDVSGCEALPVCGDGVITGDEVCDSTNISSLDCTDFGFSLPGALGCLDDCTGYDMAGCGDPNCGNGVLDAGEVCDDGFKDNCGTCNLDCSGPGTGSTCGDGVVCPETETCDDGGTNACGSCNATCSGPGTGSTCGDGVLCPDTEACDDGYTDACGSCNSNCTAPGTGSTCGDGTLCPESEACDDGGTNPCGDCNSTCTGPGFGSTCGDGIVCPEAEVCDDGGTNDCGACNADCTGPGTGSTCGDGVLCPETEACDDGGTNVCGPCNATCSGPGIGSTCGDGLVCPETESCDDGDTSECGTCNATCTGPGTGPAVCGDGIVCSGVEACDDGGTTDCGACNATCTGPGTGSTCGDGVLCPDTEVCDDGFTDSCGTCNADCSGPGTGAGVCGDGEVCAETEVCDDGGTNNCGPCNATCSGPGTGSTCGDGVVCPDTEVCDDGGTDDCGACNATCTGAGLGGGTCGDGLFCPEVEVCDDGNTDPGDGCAAACDAVETDWTCTSVSMSLSECGCSNDNPCTVGTQCDLGMSVPQCTANPADGLCGGGPELTQGTFTDSTNNLVNDYSTYTGDLTITGDGPDLVYTINLNAGEYLVAKIRDVDWDPVLAIMSDCQADSNTADTIWVSDYASSGEGEQIHFEAPTTGTYYLVVDGWSATDMGTFTLDVYTGTVATLTTSANIALNEMYPFPNDTDPGTTDKQDWVEYYNDDNVAYNLNGANIESENLATPIDFTKDVIILPNNFLVLASSRYSWENMGFDFVAYHLGVDNWIYAVDGRLRLRTSTNGEIDKVDWESNWNGGQGIVLYLDLADQGDKAANTNRANWNVDNTGVGTPDVANPN